MAWCCTLEHIRAMSHVRAHLRTGHGPPTECARARQGVGDAQQRQLALEELNQLVIGACRACQPTAAHADFHAI
eukprot:1161263-Pelagomonas_calceolata.AAC.12